MTKKFLLDTNVLMHSPKSIFVFEDNDVYVCNTTLEELDNLKGAPGETGYLAREAIRTINSLRENGEDLRRGVELPGGGVFKIVPDCQAISDEDVVIPNSWSLGKADNRIIDTAIKNEAILVTNDVSMLVKADSVGVKTEIFKNEQVSDESVRYEGRRDVYVLKHVLDNFYKNGYIGVKDLYEFSNEDDSLIVNEYLLIHDITNLSNTALGRFDGRNIVKLKYADMKPCDISPRNIGQRFALDALLAPASEIPLVIIKGKAGTAKTLLALAAGLEQTMNVNNYRKILLLRANVKFDEDIGYLKGTEEEKVAPLMRPFIDNLEVILGNKKDNQETINDKVQEVFDRGYVTAEALAYIRGRSISNNYLILDEAQNSTPNQMLGIITRAGINSKIVIIGDPDQIDNPKVDKRNNGLVFAAERMLGSHLCAQLTFLDDECVRSPLATEASRLLNKNL